MLEIIRYPDPFLREVAKPVELIDDKLIKLAEEMIETMYANKGVGLAAPQVRVGLRMAIVDIDPENRDPRVIINPVFRKRGKEKETVTEGCLSVPGIEGKVTRPEEVVCEAQDLSGKVIEYSGGGLLARALQHECDHLDGILFIDRVTQASRFAMRDELKRLEETFK